MLTANIKGRKNESPNYGLREFRCPTSDEPPPLNQPITISNYLILNQSINQSIEIS